MSERCYPLSLVGFFLLTAAAYADEPAAENRRQIEFFEARIRPLLVNRCFKCHSADAKSLKAGLRLDSRAGMLQGGDSGSAIIVGQPNDSLLLSAIRYESYEMPPDGKLSAAEIDALAKWIELGATWPEGRTVEMPPKPNSAAYDWDEAKKHWAWQPIRRPQPPTPKTGDRIANAIDRFVVARLREAGLRQPPPASAAIFVRRAFIDLIGIPPTPGQLHTWVNRLQSEGDHLDDAGVRRLVDSLLDRPQYGERWGRHWLDVARYSDGGGWSQDNKPQPSAWRYRDWVVDAFNTDMPFDDFVQFQIAGDMFDKQAAIGTGFLALGPNYKSDGGDPESIAQAKGETLDDRVDTFSRAFLGLTVSCARCHDHKFDPIPTQDYYSLAGIFNNSTERELPLATDDIIKLYDDHQKKINDLNSKINATQKGARQQKRGLSKDQQGRLAKWKRELAVLKANAPAKYDFAHTVRDTGAVDMPIALRGNLLKPGDAAPRRFLRVVAGNERKHFTDGSGRKQLAAAVVRPQNPLTARVFVNRVWLNHFGNALVRTPSNFGTLGETPTHPQLLDWLASEFVVSGWSIKSLHRLIMTSATYRASSRFEETAFERDGDNRLLWRMNPRRMDVETWRDSLLAVTGELDLTIGGPPIENIINSHRRTLYAKVSRNAPFASDEFLRLFDFPIPRATSAQRTTNVVPQQFLFMMNSQFMVDRAKALAVRLQEERRSTKDRIEHAYALLYGRKPSKLEFQAATDFVDTDGPIGVALDRWEQYCQVLLSSNEFMYTR